MKLNNVVEQAAVGKEIRLSTQELIALKDKTEQIGNVFMNYRDKRGESVGKDVRSNRETIEALTPLCEEMHNFISQIVEGVQSTSEVHDGLFTDPHANEREIKPVGKIPLDY